MKSQVYASRHGKRMYMRGKVLSTGGGSVVRESHPADRGVEPLIDKRLEALGGLTSRLFVLLCVTTVILYAAASPSELSVLTEKDRFLLEPEAIWALLPSIHLAVIATLLGSMIATEDFISTLKSPYVPDATPNYIDMFRYQKGDYGYAQVNLKRRSLVPVYTYQLIVIATFGYGLWHVYLRTWPEVQRVRWELLIANGGLSVIVITRLYQNLRYKVGNTVRRRRAMKSVT